MAVDEALAAVDLRVGAEPTEPYSVAWWETRTPEELRDLINRGFAGGQLFKAANAEIERRARLETRRLRELAAVKARRKRMEIVLGVSASALALAALLGFWLLR